MGNDINCLELQELHNQLAFELSWWNYAFINILCFTDVYFDYKSISLPYPKPTI